MSNAAQEALLLSVWLEALPLYLRHSLRTIGCMLRPVSSCFIERVACRFRTNVERFRRGFPARASTPSSTGTCLQNRAIFNFPSFPALPFAAAPRVVSFNDMRVVPYPHSIVLQVVCDVARYKEFLPWVEDSRVISSQALGRPLPAHASVFTETARSATGDQSAQLCELCVGFGPFTERYVSRVTLSHLPGGATSVKATASDSSVFSLLVNEWIVHPSTAQGSSVVKFSVAFKFKSPAYAAVAEALFTDLSRRMAAAFERRFEFVHKAKTTKAQHELK